nr:RHS repeat-associated core domain-containing protein [Tumebacillus amylolyticus]
MTPLVDATMTYTSDNRLVTFNGLPVNYDADGNLLTVPMNGMLQDFQYDARNRLISAGGYTYTYNAENIRTAVSGNGKTTNFVVNPQSLYSQVLMETDEQGNIISRYVYGLGLVGREAVDGSYSVYHYDRRGSTTSLTDASGELTDTYMYGPYGELMDHQGTTENHFLYNGRYGVVTDPNGLYYMRARYYSPEIKRFVNRDVVNGNVVDGQSMNHFAFVNGNPITGVDPFGLSRDGDDSTLSKAGDTVLDFIPWVGTIKGFQQAFNGTNYVTGQTLSTGDRWAEGIGSVTGLIPIPGAKIGGKYLAKGAFALFGGFVKQEAKEEAKQEVKRGITLNLQLFAANKAADEVVQQVTRRQAFREAKRAAGIPVSAQFLKHGYVYDGTSENRTVYEFLVDGKSKYIILHEEDKMGRGPHFHGADDSKGNPFDKGRYQQYEGHFPEDFGGFI